MKDALEFVGVVPRDLTTAELEEIIRVSLFPRRIGTILEATKMLKRPLTRDEINQVLEQCSRDWENFGTGEKLIALLPEEERFDWWEKMGDEYLRLNWIESVIETALKMPEARRLSLLRRLCKKCLVNNWVDHVFQFLHLLSEDERAPILDQLLIDALPCWYKLDRAQKIARALNRTLTVSELETILAACVTEGCYDQALKICASFAEEAGIERTLSADEFEQLLAAALQRNASSAIITIACTLPQPRRGELAEKALDAYFSSTSWYNIHHVLWLAEMEEPRRSARLIEFFQRFMKNPSIPLEWSLQIWGLLAEPSKSLATHRLFFYYVKQGHYQQAAEMADFLPTEMKTACTAALQTAKIA